MCEHEKLIGGFKTGTWKAHSKFACRARSSKLGRKMIARTTRIQIICHYGVSKYYSQCTNIATHVWRATWHAALYTGAYGVDHDHDGCGCG